MRKRRLLLNTALLTASSLLMNAVAMRFQVWLVGRIGASGIGLYQLVLSWWLLPKYALAAYIGILYVTEGMNLALSYGRLRAVTRSCPGPDAAASSRRPGGAGERCAYTAGR